MWTNLAPRMQRRDFAPGFMVRLQQKDLRLAVGAAAEVGATLPLTAIVQRLLAAVEARDGGGLGTQAIVTAFDDPAG
jgi:3-hydroxyisobutyrate dehydrogenase-like beta-hydroxyacid dehydrogenase